MTVQLSKDDLKLMRQIVQRYKYPSADLPPLTQDKFPMVSRMLWSIDEQLQTIQEDN